MNCIFSSFRPFWGKIFGDKIVKLQYIEFIPWEENQSDYQKFNIQCLVFNNMSYYNLNARPGALSIFTTFSDPTSWNENWYGPFDWTFSGTNGLLSSRGAPVFLFLSNLPMHNHARLTQTCWLIKSPLFLLKNPVLFDTENFENFG